MTRGFTHPNAPARPGIVAWDAPPRDSSAQEKADGDAPQKKRRKNTSYTQFAMRECRKRGWHAHIVEKRMPIPGRNVTIDLFNVIDVIAIAPPAGPSLGQLVGIQCTAGTSHAAHRDKILAEPRARLWVEAGARLELWTWARHKVGRSTRWRMRVEAFVAQSGMVGPAGAEVSWWNGPVIWSWDDEPDPQQTDEECPDEE